MTQHHHLEPSHGSPNLWWRENWAQAVRQAGSRARRLALVLPAAAALGVLAEVSAEGGGPLLPSETHALTASDGAANAYFGSAVSVSGGFAAVGAYGAQSGKGAVYIYARNQGGADQWQQVRKIVAPEGQASDHFGFSVCLSGDTLAVGAPDNNEWGTDAGLVYIFERNEGGADQWGLLCKVGSDDRSAGDRFGYSVSLDLNLLVVGAHGEKPDGVNSGAAYVFHRNYGVGWFRQVARLRAGDAAAGDQFGIAVAISGDCVVVGAHMDDNEHGSNAGAAYLFRRDHGGYNQWGQVRKFTGESAQDCYGRAVAIRGPWIILGAPNSTEGGSFGRAYIYERNQNGPEAWGWVKTLSGASNSGAEFGGAVAIDSQKALVGATMERVASLYGGAVFVFGRDEGGWGQWGLQIRLLAADRAGNDYFGSAVAMDGSLAVVGAHGDDPQGSSAGSARVLRWQGNRWYFEQKLTNSHPDFPRSGDQCGTSVALKDGWLAVGAPRPAAYSTVLWHTTQTTAGHPSVTLFRRHGPGQNQPWSAGQDLLYDDLGEDDFFGRAVAFSGEQLVVGAPRDRASYPRGMSYVFERNQGGPNGWGQVQRLNQHNRHDFEDVGQYLAMDRDTIVLGSSGAFIYENADWYDLYEYADFWDDDTIAEGGNTYIYCRDAGGLSGNWKYRRRYEFWSTEEVVALSGNTLVVGLPSNEARLYGRNQGGKDAWGQIKTVTAPAGTRDHGFGGSVALAGDTLVVGPMVKKLQDNAGALPEGDAVFVFQRNAGGADQWGLVREVRLGSSYGAAGFGISLALSEDYLLVGAAGQSNKAGAVYLFERNNGGADRWGLVRKFTAPTTWWHAWFGQSMAIDHDLVAVGAPGDDQSAPAPSGAILLSPQAGSVYVFQRGNNRSPTMTNLPSFYFFSVEEDAEPGWISAHRVSTLVQRSQMADADGDACGMAVIAANNSGGQWQYSIDGSNWFDLRFNTPDTARVLDAQALIRFVPGPNFSGPVNPGITFRAWDQSVWGTGGLANASEAGGNSPFSEQIAIFNAQVSPINDPPVIQPGESLPLPNIYGNILSQYNRGQSVSNLLQGRVVDADTNVCGIAVTGVLNTHGDWQYSLDGGGAWRSFSAAQPNSARLLGPSARVRFMPVPNYSGTVVDGLTFAAWDQTSGTSGAIASIQSSTAFSRQTMACGITVTPVVNHAPILDLFGNPAFPPMAKGASVADGVRISHLLNGWVEDWDGDECGLALVQTDSTHGRWDYSLNDGATWLEVGLVSFDAALLLGPEARLRFLPSPDYTGTILVAILYRAWDQTSGIEGEKISAHAAGGNSSLSVGIEPAPITISRFFNRPPSLAAPYQIFLTSIREGDTNSPGDRISTLLNPLVTDLDGDACGIAVFGMTTNYGYWEYSVDREANWRRLGEVSTRSARLLGPNTWLRFIPAVGFTGTVTNGLEFRAWDRSSGTNDRTASLAIYGGGTPFSGRSGWIGITIGPFNHTPKLLATESVEMTPVIEGQHHNPGDLVSNLLHQVVADRDGDACGLAVLEIPEVPGAWQYSLDGGQTWTPMSPLPLGLVRLLGPEAVIRFVPDPGFAGMITNGFHFRAWDQSSGVSGGTAWVPPNSRQTAFSAEFTHTQILVREANLAPFALRLDSVTVLENQPRGKLVGILFGGGCESEGLPYLYPGAGHW